MDDIMVLDREIEGLRLGSGRSTDPGLALLLEFRDDVDERAAGLLGRLDDEQDEWPQPPAAAPAPRRRRHHRLAVVPIAGALVLASTGAAAALSGSPHAPLYELHQLIFGTTSSSSAQVDRDLTEAQVLEDRAGARPFAGRADDLAQVRILLAEAQSLLPRAGSDRGPLSIRLSVELARLAQLEKPPVTGGTGPSPAPLPTQRDEESPSAPDASNGESEAPGVAPGGGESEAPESVAPAGTAPVAEAPESAPSPTPTHVTEWRNDQPTSSESETPETRPSSSPRPDSADN